MNQQLAGQTIGFVGLGNMGMPMAGHLARAGANVVVWNRTANRVDEAVAQGMTRASSVAELSGMIGGGMICINLTHTEIVESIVFDEEGLYQRLHGDSLIIDFGTTSVLATRRFARKVNWLDAPVSGGQVGAKAATLSILVGGSDDNYQRALPILKVLGKRITHLGPSGAGQVTKLANQLIVSQTIDAVAQALRLAELSGVDAAAARQAMLGGFADSRILDLHGDRIARRDFVAGGRAALQLKDVRLICELAKDVGLESPTLTNSLAQWEKFVDELGFGELDHSGLFKLYE